MSAKATAIFEADDKHFSAAMLGMQKKLLSFQHSIAKLVGGFEVIKKAAEAASWGFEEFGAALEKGSELVNLSANTGIAVEDLMVLQRQFEMAGKTAEDVGPALAKMMKNIETGKSAEMVKRLGLNIEELRHKSPAEQFSAIGQAINALPDPAQRATAAMDVFGKSGATLLAVFASHGFGDAAEQIGNQSKLLGKDAALFKDVSEKLHLVGLKVQGFFVGVADKVVPMIKPLLDRFATMDFSKMGQQFGDVVAILFEAFKNGNAASLIALALQVGFGDATNFLFKQLMGIGAVIALYIGNPLLIAALRFGAAMKDAVADVMSELQNIPWLGDKIADSAVNVRVDANKTRTKANNLEDDNKEKAKAENVVPVFNAAVEKTGNIINTADAQARLDKLSATLLKGAAKHQEEALKEVPTIKPGEATGEDFMVKPAFSHLQKIGGGGYGGGGADLLLTENRKQTGVLSRIETGINKLVGKPPEKTGGSFVFS